MKVKLLDQNATRTFAVVFDKGDEFVAGMERFAGEHHLGGSRFTAIGAFSSVVLGFFDRERMGYKKIPIDEQVEVLSLIGNIACDKGHPKVHSHAVVGRPDGTTRGGHVMEARVWPTLEVIVVETPEYLRREIDEETGLALIDIEPTGEPVAG